MGKSCFYTILIITLFLVMISGLITGCANSPSELTPPSSSYPADIIGRVIIAKIINSGNTSYTPMLVKDSEFWVVQTSIRNKEYQIPITSETNYTLWTIEAKPTPKGVWGVRETRFNSPLLTITQGQSGEMILCFDVAPSLDPNNYQICYKGAVSPGQLPDPASYSYGNLVNTGTMAEVYDWDSQKVIQVGNQVLPTTEQTPDISTKGIATVESMNAYLWGLDVILKPQKAKANTTYSIQLYEKGKLRQEGTLTWTQPQINVKDTKLIRFNLNQDEITPYSNASMTNLDWWKDIFSINIKERN